MFYSIKLAAYNIGSRFTTESKGFKVLYFIAQHDQGATKYSVLTDCLNKKGTKQQLRGYYSVYFQSFVDNGMLTLNRQTNCYSITPKGRELIVNTLKK